MVGGGIFLLANYRSSEAQVTIQKHTYYLCLCHFPDIQWLNEAHIKGIGKYILPIVRWRYKVTWQSVYMCNPITAKNLRAIRFFKLLLAGSKETLKVYELWWAEKGVDKESR